MRKVIRKYKQWLFPALMGFSLLVTGIVTGAWAFVALSAYMLGVFASFVNRHRPPVIIALLMLPVITSKISALEDWQRDAEQHVIAEARQFEQYIIRSNTEEQLYRRGQDAEGNEVTPFYTPFTIQIKQAKGQPTDRVTLFDTGQFHASFYVEWRPTEFELYAKDPLTPKLAGKYGPDIFGLDDDRRQDLIDNLRRPLLDNLKKAIEA